MPGRWRRSLTGFRRGCRTAERPVGLSESVEFMVASGADTGLPDASLDRASPIHVGMNIPDKAAVFAEVHRVLTTGGLLGVYEQMRIGPGDLTYPLPWVGASRAPGRATKNLLTRPNAVAPPAGFEPATQGLGNLCSIP